MNWTELIEAGMGEAYRSTYGLMEMVEDGDLGWKPATGDNWMTTGQLLMHITTACGLLCKGFVTGHWEMPGGFDATDAKPEDMLPPAEALPTTDSVAAARTALEADERTARESLAQAGEKRLATEQARAPWDPKDVILGRRLLQMVEHLQVHKAQLFYYLKLQGKPVNTFHMYGMP